MSSELYYQKLKNQRERNQRWPKHKGETVTNTHKDKQNFSRHFVSEQESYKEKGYYFIRRLKMFSYNHFLSLMITQKLARDHPNKYKTIPRFPHKVNRRVRLNTWN